MCCCLLLSCNLTLIVFLFLILFYHHPYLSIYLSLSSVLSLSFFVSCLLSLFISLSLFFSFFSFFSFFFFLFLSLSLSLMQILDHGAQVPLCVTCRIPRPVRSKHCSICGYCIAKMDHHCGWVNNCIGQKNYLLFLVFLVSMFSTLFFFLQHLVQCVEHSTPAVGVCSYTLFFSFYLRFFTHRPLTFLFLLLILFFEVFVGHLFLSHIQQIVKNITTNEGKNIARYSHFYLDTGILCNPFSRCVFLTSFFLFIIFFLFFVCSIVG